MFVAVMFLYSGILTCVTLASIPPFVVLSAVMRPMLRERLNEKFDIYHARQFTGEASGDCADESLYIRKCAAQVR